MSATVLLPRVADCEARDGVLFAQPMNAWSSIAFLAVGAAISWSVIRRPKLPTAFLALGAAVAAEGVGSIMYHGGSSKAGHYVHDVALVAALGFVVGWQVGRLISSRAAASGALVGASLFFVVDSINFWTESSWTDAIVAVLVVSTVATEIAARVRRLPGLWNAPIIALVVVSMALWQLGTPSSPLCDDESLIQPHAFWHVFSAVVILAWFDRACFVANRQSAPRLFRRFGDRSIGLIAKVLVLTFHREVGVIGPQRDVGGTSTLLVVNHGNGFVDPVVVAAVLGRVPRFLAKAALWKVVPARPFLGLAGALPVYRRRDGDEVGNNRSVFAACHDELAAGATVAIFPEGTTGDRAGLDEVKTGAARIGLGAIDRAPDLLIVPIGLAFESRVETRTRAAVEFGPPIKAADFHRHPIGDDGEPDHDDVDRLTDAITVALADVSPEFASIDDRDTFRAAARASRLVDRHGRPASFADVEMTARAIAASSPEHRTNVTATFDRFARRLVLTNLREEDLIERDTSIARLLVAAVGLVAFGTVLITAFLTFLPAILIVVGSTAMIRSTATKGTVRLLVGLIAGLATIVVTGMVLGDGWGAVLAGILVAVEGALALIVWTPLTRIVESVVRHTRRLTRGSAFDRLVAERSAVVEAVHDAVMDSELHL